MLFLCCFSPFLKTESKIFDFRKRTIFLHYIKFGSTFLKGGIKFDSTFLKGGKNKIYKYDIWIVLKNF